MLLPTLSQASSVLCLGLVLLVPFVAVGLSLVNSGLGRSRSAAHIMLTSICAVGVSAIVYVVVGFAWQGTAAGPAHSFVAGGRGWNWVGASPLFLRGMPLDSLPTSLIVLLQVFSVGLASLVPLSAGSDRWKLGAACASSALLAGIVYPLFAHWVWAGGWLAQLSERGLGRGFLDCGGAATIQGVGGMTALSIAWILGPRRGKFSSEGVPAGIPGHNAVLAIAGCMLAWIGWLGLNAAGAILFANVDPSQVVLICINTTMSAVAAGLTAAVITRTRFGRPDASLCANGWMAGLVASSAAAAFLKPAAAILLGIVAGALVIYSIDLIESRLLIDDPGGAISVHGIAAIWGLMSVPLLSTAAPGGQWLAQLAGVATLLGFVLPLAYALNWLLDRIYPQRVQEEGEYQGMDLYELGAGAYPEFVVHSDEFIPR